MSVELWASSAAADAERWDGPFGTREEAVASLDGQAGVVAVAGYIDPGDYCVDAVDLGIDGIVERMNEDLFDQGPEFDEDIFTLQKPGAEAEISLEKVLEQLRVWARENITANGHWEVIGESEDVPAVEA